MYNFLYRKRIFAKFKRFLSKLQNAFLLLHFDLKKIRLSLVKKNEHTSTVYEFLFICRLLADNFVNGVQIRSCSCHFNHYILWQNSPDLKNIVYRNLLLENCQLVENYYKKQMQKIKLKKIWYFIFWFSNNFSMLSISY